MIKTLLEQKYGQFVTNQLLTEQNEVIKENWNKDGVEEQKNVIQTIKSFKDLNGDNLVPDNFWNQPVEWGFDFSSWVGNYDNKEFFIIGAEPHIHNNYQLVYDFGNLKGKTLHESANEHYANKNDIWHYLTNIFVDNPTPDSITEFLNKCYITDLCHVVPKGCGQVNTICEKLSIQPGEWYKFRTAVAKRFLLEEIKAVNPKVVILHGNASREFFQYELGVKYTHVYPIDNCKYTIKVGALEGYKIISIPHLKGDMKNKLWKCKQHPERPLSAKKLLNEIISQDNTMLLMPQETTIKSDTDIKSWVDGAFQRLREATSIAEVELIPDYLKILPQNKLSTESYPELKYSLTVEEIQDLKGKGLIQENNTFSADLPATDLDPIAKLLYAIAWKNGDLQKVKHIVAGVLDCKETDTHNWEEGIVFYQFGRYLSKTPGEPIIDQHVLRAFGISQTNDLSEIKRLRKRSVITKKENKIIKAYKSWLQTGEGLQESLRKEEGYTYHLDKLLFAIGKTVKIK